MMPQWFIEEKRDGREHREADIRAWVAAVTDGSLPDYQLSAWLMAVCLRGMTAEETAVLTDAMMRSGETIAFDPALPTVDKHSTGGIGDKISIPLAPLAAAMGLAVPMISGRGLGLTGGTLDKLETIPGFRTDLSAAEFRRLTAEVGCCMIGQTDGLAPADRRMYALRDVTGTVPSIPLITASIMSKKLAEGAAALLFDVKTGCGAFMRRREEAAALAESLLAVGRRLGRRCTALITDMDQPLGRTVGNALEVRESLKILQGAGPGDVRELTLTEAAHMGVLTGRFRDYDAAHAAAVRALDSGAAMERFRAMVRAQGGAPDAPLPEAACRRDVPAPRGGTGLRVDAEAIGRAALCLGAGRRRTDETPDPGAGISALVRQGEEVRAGEPLCRLHAASEALLEAQAEAVAAAVTLTEGPVPERTLVFATL